MTTALPPRLAGLRARDLMSRDLITLRVDETMTQAAHRLREADITGAPVVNEQGRLVGILSATDIMTYEQQHGTVGGGPTKPAAAVKVEEYMSPRVDSVADDALLVSIARQMCDGHYHRLVVVDRDQRVSGIISTMDILAALVNYVDEAEAAAD
jgi:CBS-domain-containing membrane protein